MFLVNRWILLTEGVHDVYRHYVVICRSLVLQVHTQELKRLRQESYMSRQSRPGEETEQCVSNKKVSHATSCVDLRHL